MLRKLTRDIWCILVKWIAPCNDLQRLFVKRSLNKARMLREIRAQQKRQAQKHAWLMSMPIYKSEFKIKEYLKSSPNMRRFVILAAAHYNTQEDLGKSNPKDRYYIKSDIESMVDIAADYFRRNRCGLVEWWCKFDTGYQMFLTENDKIMLDLKVPFAQVFKEKCLRELDIEVTPDNPEHRRHLGWPCLDIHGNPNISLMNKVQAKAHVY